VIDENMHDEMKITVIATGFEREAVAVASTAAPLALPATAPRYAPRPADDLPRPMMSHSRSDDLDVPTFIRKKAD
jgi:cell division protein FtsZ